ncbi:hypothetical protein, partial [Bartonella sp. CL45QHWL]|uniref:hypothetical protein n=1 Tax=Bartonella sp. CL45QHWL TaxID=3243533 RepID=UPI0035CEB5E0
TSTDMADRIRNKVPEVGENLRVFDSDKVREGVELRFGNPVGGQSVEIVENSEVGVIFCLRI